VIKKNKPNLNPIDVDVLIGAMKVVFPTRTNVEEIIDEKLTEKIKLLPTKEEFFGRMDKLSGEIKASRDEQTLHQGQHDDIDSRLKKVETKLNLSSFA